MAKWGDNIGERLVRFAMINDVVIPNLFEEGKTKTCSKCKSSFIQNFSKVNQSYNYSKCKLCNIESNTLCNENIDKILS